MALLPSTLTSRQWGAAFIPLHAEILLIGPTQDEKYLQVVATGDGRERMVKEEVYLEISHELQYRGALTVFNKCLVETVVTGIWSGGRHNRNLLGR